ncbi:MAG TPA: class I SAM-dependent rRNA methyltransferase [Vicinamibacterales bacterium]|nr:class I SAM-dependent rRNA methyltransferase [Vicinamibacterales bacterium]
MPPTVVVTRRGAERLHAGHPWVYRTDVVSSDAEPGDLVRVVVDRRRPIGWALWSSASQIALRLVSTDRHVEEAALWRARLERAAAYRTSLRIDATAYRLVHGESDGLPGLIVDRYGDCLVVQALCQGMDRRLSALAEALTAIERPRGILARNDPKVRRLEGLPESVEVLSGDVPDVVTVSEGPIQYEVDLRHGQKTGLFLDQRENHEAAARYGRGRALDAFTYSGGFALRLAPVCDRVLAFDSSDTAVAAARRHAASNGFTHVDVQAANAFDALRELDISGERFDTIVLDPPAFAKNKASVPRAVAGYKEINLRAMKLLSPGGHLISCSCSYHVHEELLQGILESAAADARATMVLVEKRMQARDHPVLVGMPETYYLKCLVLRRVV